MSPQADAVLERLDAARQRWWLFTLLSTAAMAAWVSLATLLLLLLGDALLRFSRGVLWGMFLAWLALSVVLAASVIVRLLRSRRSLEATARRVESVYPELGSHLINLVQLAAGGDHADGDRAFSAAAANRAAAEIGSRRFEAAAARLSHWRRFVCCMQTPWDLAVSAVGLGLLVAVAVLCHWSIPAWSSATTRMMAPWSLAAPVERAEVQQRPAIAEVEVTLRYPAYLGRAAETFVQQDADIEAPQYTIAELRIRPSVAVAKGQLQFGSQEYLGRVEDAGMLVVFGNVPLLRDGTFTVQLFDSDNHTDPDPRVNRVHVVPDGPPSVQLVKPPREGTAAPGAEVAVVARANDDHGLGELWLEMKTPQTDQEESTPKMPLQGATAVLREHVLLLDPQQFEPGQTVLLRAVARDRRSFSELGRSLGPQETASAWHAIRLIPEEDEQAAALEQLDRVRRALWKILETQIRARVDAAIVLHQPSAAERIDAAGGVRTAQIEIHGASTDLVASIGASEHAWQSAVKQALNSLAMDEMLRAVQHCDGLVKLKTAEQFDGPVADLLATQDEIIEVLRALLDAVRRAESELLAEMPTRPGGDLPDDVRRKLQELRDKLDEALQQQRKVVEAAEDLAKAPVEDFAEAREQLLRALAAAEDDWSRFITELNTDLSKLPEQDFANPSMLKELVEIQTEIKMAEDALLAETVDIAVPLEQLGAEMAEELLTNLEKWLPDTPDRERWSQEELPSDLGKEAPMAELPGELEDLVGELMEEEEDLFDEMEDISSSAADSLDAGAGWDAMDGPISNFSARGVTGNRLPNTSEIGGRSGEGRSAKASGEFVGEEAVGKGGRKTPSRLTPDPYVDGQIQDHSRDPVGGATGGGKESGQGGQGLEGPVPRTPAEREMERLAGRQATLRNKAEGIDLQFQILNFHHTDLGRLIDMMAQIERDLKAGRYQNALRQRRVLLDGLGAVKQHVGSEFELRQDTTTSLPSEVQKEILGSIGDPSPAGWEELNRQYFERLANGGP